MMGRQSKKSRSRYPDWMVYINSKRLLKFTSHPIPPHPALRSFKSCEHLLKFDKEVFVYFLKRACQRPQSLSSAVLKDMAMQFQLFIEYIYMHIVAHMFILYPRCRRHRLTSVTSPVSWVLYPHSENGYFTHVPVFARKLVCIKLFGMTYSMSSWKRFFHFSTVQNEVVLTRGVVGSVCTPAIISRSDIN